MKQDNSSIVIAKHPYMGEVIALTNDSHSINNARYLLNLEQQVYEDEETKILISMIRLLTEENKSLRKENQRLAKIHN